jgi:hypothetical protein
VGSGMLLPVDARPVGRIGFRGGPSGTTGRETRLASASWRARPRDPLPHPRSPYGAYRKQPASSSPPTPPSTTALIFSLAEILRRVARRVSRAVLSTSRVRSRGDEGTAAKSSPRCADRIRHREADGAAAGRGGRSPSSLPHAFSGGQMGGWSEGDDISMARLSARAGDLVAAAMCAALPLAGESSAR